VLLGRRGSFQSAPESVRDIAREKDRESKIRSELETKRAKRRRGKKKKKKDNAFLRALPIAENFWGEFVVVDALSIFFYAFVSYPIVVMDDLRRESPGACVSPSLPERVVVDPGDPGAKVIDP